MKPRSIILNMAVVSVSVVQIGCQAIPSTAKRISETRRIVAQTNGREGLFGFLIDGGVTSIKEGESLRITPIEGRDSLRVVLVRKDMADLVHDTTNAAGETWVFSASSAAVGPSRSVGDIQLKFEDATLFPGLVGNERNVGQITFELPALP